MSQYNNIPLQNTCDLSQNSNNLSLSLHKLGLVDTSRPTAALSTEIISNPLNQKKEITLPSADGKSQSITRQIGDESDSKNTLTLDGKTYIKKSQIVDETSSYSHFRPNEKTILLPLVVRSLVTDEEWQQTYMPAEQQELYLKHYGHVCKQRDLLTLERQQKVDFNKSAGRVSTSLRKGHDFFDKRVKAVSIATPVPTPPPVLSKFGGGDVGKNESNSSRQANPLTNEPYLDKKEKSLITKGILEHGDMQKVREIPPKIAKILQEAKQNHSSITKTYDHYKNPDQVNLTIELNGWGCRFKIDSDESRYYQRVRKMGASTGSLGKRGQITEMSPRSRHRLFEKTLNWEILGYEVEFMQTVTMPGEYASLNISGERLKYLWNRYYKKVDRWLLKQGITKAKAMWVLEFQRRGAPHYHLIYCDTGLAPDEQQKFTELCANWWADLIGHPNKEEYAKHKKRGVQLETLKNKDLRYLRSYMSKKYQKIVPKGYEGVGRFWGAWFEPKFTPITFTAKVSDQILSAIKEMALIKYRDISHKIARRVHRGITDRFAGDSMQQNFAHKLYGNDVVNWFLDIIPLFEIRACQDHSVNKKITR